MSLGSARQASNAAKGSDQEAVVQDTAGLILAGGRASRMQRGENPPVDKGLLELHGKPLVAHVHAQMAPCVSRVYVSANRNAAAYSAYGEVIVDDPVFEVDSGPLAGIASALRLIPETALFVWPVDVPIMPVAVISRLREAARLSGSRLAYLATDEGAHPLCLWLERSLADNLTQYLLEGGRRVQHWLDRQGACRVLVAVRGAELANVNTPAELESVYALYQDSRSDPGR